MAELPRYQPTGRVFADVPQLDFANVRESFKQSQNMSSALDKLSQFAYKQAAIGVEKEATEFSINNPITLEQLKEAEKSGVTAADLIKASGGGAIWQETVKKYQAAQLRTQLEVEAQSAGMQILNDVKTNKISGNEVGAKFDSLVNGMGKPLAGLDPEEYVKYKSSVGAVVKSLNKAALDKVYDDYTLEAQIRTTNYMKIASDALDVLFKTEKNPEVIQTQKRLFSQTLINTSKESGKPEYTLKTINDFDKIFEDKQINYFESIALSPEFSKDASGNMNISLAINKLTKGEIGADSALWATLSQENKDKVIKQSYSVMTSQYEANNKQREAEKNSKEQELLGLTQSLVKGKLTGAAAVAGWDTLLENKVITIAQYQSALEPKKPEKSSGQIYLEAQAAHDIRRGSIRNINQLQSKYGGKLNVEQIAGLWKTIDNEDEQNANLLHSKYSGALADPGRSNPNTQKIWTVIDKNFKSNQLEIDPQTKLLKYNSQTEAMDAAIKKWTDDVDFKNAAIRQKSSASVLTELGVQNPDAGWTPIYTTYTNKYGADVFTNPNNKKYDAAKSLKDTFDKFDNARKVTQRPTNKLPSREELSKE